MRTSRPDKGIRIPYPIERTGELDKYKEKLLEEDRPEQQGSSPDFYEKGPVLKKIIQTKKMETVSPILKKLIVGEHVGGMKPLKTIGSDVVGSLFDRTRFLSERIEETKVFIEERKLMHEKFDNDIDTDIVEMEKILPSISDREELREFKINLNLLKMEKRKEDDLFWRDVMALRNQLRELKEQFEMESKISKLFSDLDTF